MRKIIIAICFILIHTSWGIGQSVTIKQFTVQEGMPSAEVYDIFQDRTGFIWFATDNGVVKYDGYALKTYQLKDGLADPVIFGFHEDVKGRIWFRSYSGRLSYYENEVITPYVNNKTLLEKTMGAIIQSIHLDENNTLSFSTLTIGVAGEIDSLGKFKPIHYAEDIVGSRSLFYQKKSHGHLLSFGSDSSKTLHATINGKISSVQLPDATLSFHISTATWKDQLLLGVGKNIFSYNGSKLKHVYTSKALIISMSTDNQGGLWIGYSDADPDYFKETFNNPQTPYFLQGKSLTKALQDTEGGMWFSTLESGIFFVPNFSLYTNRIPTDSKISDAVVTRNYIILGDYEGNLLYFNKGSRLMKSKDVLHPVVRIFETQSGNIWISTAGKLYLSNQDLRELKLLTHATFYSMMEDPDHSIWLLSNTMNHFDSSGLFIERIYMDKVTYRNSILKNEKFILTDKTGGIYSASKTLSSISNHPAFESQKISKMISLSDSSYLICTVGDGFYITDSNLDNIMEFSLGKNFIANNIYSALQIDSTLWLGTEKGVVKAELSPGAAPKYSFLTKDSGLPGNKINFLLHNDVKNEIWAFTDEEYSIIPEKINQFSNNEPTFYLKNIKVNGIVTSTEDIQDLSYNENNIQIDFGFIAFNHQDIILRYKLSEERNWTYSTNRFIYLYSIGSGDYKLNLEYSTDHASWKSAPLDLSINISPVWWKTFYFQLTALLILGLGGFFFFRNRIMQYREREKLLGVITQHQQQLIKAEINALERERNRIAKELHDSVGTDLSALKLIVGQMPKDSSQVTVEEQLQSTIHEIKNIVYNLTPPGIQRYGLSTILKSYIDRLSSSDVKIDLNSFGENTVSQETGIIIFRIIQELLSNSLKHSSAKQITIHLDFFEDLISLVYEDDGTGFSYDQIKPGLGLQNIESRIKSLKGTMKFESGDFGISYTIDIPLTEELQ